MEKCFDFTKPGGGSRNGGEMTELLEVKNLSVSFETDQGEVQAVRDVSFTLRPGETLAIVGESGCGKSALCKSIMKLLPASARIKSGSICVNGVEISGYREREMQKLRGKLFSMVLQDPLTALNPTMSVGAQIAEAVRVHQPKISRKAVHDRVLELMRLVEIDRAQELMNLYPYSFSGGMRQRCVLAIALAGSPAILFADEPTTALDVTIQAQILKLLRDLQRELGMASVLVTHDLGVAAQAADRVAVMYAGKIVETGTAEEIFRDPRHPYTWGLMQALPSFSKDRETLDAIPGMPPALIDPPKGDAFACRNPYALAIDYEEEPPMFRVSDTHCAATWLLDERAPKITPPISLPAHFFSQKGAPGVQKLSQKGASGVEKPATEQGGNADGNEGEEPGADVSREISEEILLDVQHLTHTFALDKKSAVTAVDDISFQIKRGEIFGLVGESGSGKSTVARCIMNIYQPRGRILYRGIDTCDREVFRANRKMLQSVRQIIFQDSDSSLNQRMKVCDIITEPMKIQHRIPPRGSYRAEAAFQMHYVGLDEKYLDRRPFELSGGQRQRVAIARALTMEPELLVADEPIAALDVSIQAQIVNLFRHLQKEHGFSFLFIAHDLAMVRFLCDRVGVMRQGKLVEVGETKRLFAAPQHPYTKALLDAAYRIGSQNLKFCPRPQCRRFGMEEK